MKYTGEEIRLFIGVEAPPQLRAEIEFFRQELSETPWLSWTKPEQLHLTIFFLGNVRVEMVENLISLFRLGYLSRSPITISSGKWAWAPSYKNPRMIWIRFAKSEAFSELVHLSQDWFSQIQQVPQQRLRPIPHITVARFRPEEMSPVELPTGQLNRAFKIDTLTLWRSDPGKSGVIYSPLATFRLGGKH